MGRIEKDVWKMKQPAPTPGEEASSTPGEVAQALIFVRGDILSLAGALASVYSDRERR